MEYITYVQAEQLLRSYPSLKALLNNYQVELEQLWRYRSNSEISEDDILYSLAIGNRVLSDLPRPTNRSPGDKEISIIEQKDRIINKDYMQDMIHSINTIGEVVEKTNNAMQSLNRIELEVINLFYFEKRTWKEVLKEIKISEYLDERKGRKLRRDAIEKMVKIIRVTNSQFNFCMQRIGLKIGKGDL